MPTSGVEVPDKCVEDFKELKLRHKQRCMIFVIKDEKEFTICKKIDKGKGSQEKDFDDVVQYLTSDTDLLAPLGPNGEGLKSRNPCIIVWDLDVPCKSGGQNSQTTMEHGVLLFMKVCPDAGVPIKKKMLLASSMEALKQKLPGVGKILNIDSMEDLTYKNVLDAMK